MKNFPDVMFQCLQAGLAVATVMILALLFSICYQVAIKPDLEAWRRNRKAKARRISPMQTA